MVIEPATVDDLDAIAAIGLVSFARPWPRQTYADELARPHARVIVARADATVRGYAVTWSVGDEVELLQIATAPDARRRGVGQALLGAVCAAADRSGARQLVLEVRADNQAARALYAGHGFAVIATRRGYYADDGQDAVVMIRPRS
jgi:[ribosomal protein S18]-alanine N-acetyltransferase